MDRKILFRGKQTDNGEWVEGLPSYDINGNLEEIEVYRGFCNCNTYEVDPSTVCQYTGLTDKNGRKIFEGDIVGFEDYISTESEYWEQSCVGEVGWSEKEAAFYVTNRLMAESYEVLQDCEVIGNVFENPELIKNG